MASATDKGLPIMLLISNWIKAIQADQGGASNSDTEEAREEAIKSLELAHRAVRDAVKDLQSIE